MQHLAPPAPRPRPLVSLLTPKGHERKPRRRRPGDQSEENEATNGHGMENGGSEEAGRSRRAAGFEERHAEDCGGAGEIGWYRESGLR